jgi:hypothetical protein
MFKHDYADCNVSYEKYRSFLDLCSTFPIHCVNFIGGKKLFPTEQHTHSGGIFNPFTKKQQL